MTVSNTETALKLQPPYPIPDDSHPLHILHNPNLLLLVGQQPLRGATKQSGWGCGMIYRNDTDISSSKQLGVVDRC